MTSRREGALFRRCRNCGQRVAPPSKSCGYVDQAGSPCGGEVAWGFVVDVAAPGAKRRKRRTRSGFATKKEALAAMREVQQADAGARSAGGPGAPARARPRGRRYPSRSRWSSATAATFSATRTWGAGHWAARAGVTARDDAADTMAKVEARARAAAEALAVLFGRCEETRPGALSRGVA